MIDLGAAELSMLLTPFDIKRLNSYANNLLDYHVVLDFIANGGITLLPETLR